MAAAGALSELDGAQLDGVIAALERASAKDPLDAQGLGDLQRLGLTPEQSRGAARWIQEMRIGTLNPDLMTSVLGSMDVGGSEKAVLIKAFKQVLNSETLTLRGPELPLIRPVLSAALEKEIEITHYRDAETDAPKRFQIPPLSRNAKNRDAFHKFVSEHKDDPELRGKYVAFVDGKYQKTGVSKASLVQDMHEKFGHVKMYVGEVAAEPRILHIGSPERI